MSKYDKSLIEECIKNYSKIKEIVNTMTLDELKNELVKIKIDDELEEKKCFVDNIKKILEIEFPEIPDFTHKIEKVKVECDEYEHLNNDFRSDFRIEFDKFRLGISYNGSNELDDELWCDIGSNIYDAYYENDKIVMCDMKLVKKEVLKIMDYYDVNKIHLETFTKLIIILLSIYNNINYIKGYTFKPK